MSIKTRLVKLEAASRHEREQVHIAIFTAAPGVEPSGYVCGDAQIFRKPGEGAEDLQTRCIDSVTWPEGNNVLMFDLMENSNEH